MKSINKILLFVFFLAVLASLSFLYFFNFSKAYEDKTTHRALTDEIIDFYNLFYEPKITDEQKEWIVEGSKDEDIYPRWMNHYYDPIYNAGWQGEGSGYLPDWFVKGGARALVADKKPISSLEWMRNQELQISYGEFGGNRTWDRALYEMAKNNNEKEAYYTLGFTLHLMEDAAVPDHTRNDSHAPGVGGDEGSPYEQYADQFTRENFSVAMDLRNAGYKPVEKNTIDYYLHSLALYSNKNFFSKDTIFDEKYKEPKIISEWKIGEYLYGIGEEDNGIKFPLVKIDLFQTRTGIQKNYTLLSSKQSKAYELILSDYFRLLSRQAITNGAGIINLFHQEAEKARQNPENLIPLPEFKTVNQAVSLFSEISKNGVYKGVADAFERAMEKYAIYKPIDFTMNLAASAFNIFKELDDANPRKLTTGFSNNQLIDNVVEKVSLIAQETAKEINETVKNIDPSLLMAGIIKTQILAPKIVSEDKEFITVQAGKIKVKFIIDGDTFILGDDTRIRLIGIDAPEENECFYDEAKNMLADLILGKEIILEKDISDADKYGRLLRYGRINDILVNDYMIREGFAEEWAYGSDIKYREKFTESQNYAQNNKLGIWLNCQNNKIAPRNSNSQDINSLEYIIASIGNNNPPQAEPEPEPEQQPQSELEPESESEPEPEPEPEPELEKNQEEEEEEDSGDSEEIIEDVILDTVGPTAQINITNYNLMSTVFNVGWSAAEEDTATTTFEPQYKIGESGEWQNLGIENNGEFTAEQDKTSYYFRVRVQDINGNQGDWSEIAEAEINTKPIIFNEIAWMGTLANSYDEWIELYNTSGQSVDITGWQIIARNNNPSITIFDASVDSFAIAPYSYFLLERSDNETISNIAADFLYSGLGSSQNMMENNGEWLYLKDANGNVIDEIGAFYAGQSTSSVKKTMERVRSDVGFDVSANWLTYEGEGSEAQDANGNPIFGTPKSQNSVHNKYYAVGNDISENTTFYEENSPYFVYNSFTVSKDKTLTVEAGVEIQIADNIQITIDGTLKSQGDEENNIIFTSSNENPQAGDWSKIYFSPTSVNSEMNYTDILYGGRWVYGFGGLSTAIEVATSTVAFDNILIKESKYRGLWLKNSDSSIVDSVFENINYESSHTMIEINGGSPAITNSVFRNTNGNKSWYGISIAGGAVPRISKNTISNTNYPVIIFDADPIFSENAATNNFYDGVYLQSEINADTVLEQDLPYFIDYIYVINKASLTLNSGVEIKLGNGGAIIIDDGGVLKAIGTSDKKIKFIGDSSSPWTRIHFTDKAGDGSEIDYVVFENGGYGNYLNGAMIKIENIPVSIKNTEIINSYSRGIWLKNSNSQIVNVLFKCNGYIDNGGICGVLKTGGMVPAFEIENSDPIISGGIFKLNRIGIKADEYSNPTFENITFGEGDEANYTNTDPVDLLGL